MHRSNRKLGIETLETRSMLAGNVFVGVNSGDLIIRGDAVSNNVTLARVGVGTYRVTGLGSAGQATRINNGTVPVVVRGVNDDVICNLFGGNDRIQVGNTTSDTAIPDDLTINGGANSDTVVLHRVRADAVVVNLGVATENHIDKVIARSSNFRGSASIAMGGGNDTLDVANCRVNGELKITLNAGDDTAKIDSGFAGSVNLQCGGGDDFGRFSGVLEVAGNVLADGGDGIDTGVIVDGTEWQVGGTKQFLNFESGSGT